MSDNLTTIKHAKELLLRKNKTLAEQSARIAELEAIVAGGETPEHTPGDTWTYSGGLRGGCIMPDNVYGSPLTIRHEWGEPTPEGAIATANMKHIVRAVNCHDNLLGLLKIASECIQSLGEQLEQLEQLEQYHVPAWQYHHTLGIIATLVAKAQSKD